AEMRTERRALDEKHSSIHQSQGERNEQCVERRPVCEELCDENELAEWCPRLIPDRIILKATRGGSKWRNSRYDKTGDLNSFFITEPQEQRGFVPSPAVPLSTTMLQPHLRLVQNQRSPVCMTMEEPPFSGHSFHRLVVIKCNIQMGKLDCKREFNKSSRR